VDTLLDEPALVLVVLSLAAALFVIEVALPTAGVAGSLALVFGVIAAVAVVRQDATWWPLVGPKLAVVIWAVMIARRQRSPALEGIAIALFAGGSVTFGVLADSPAAAGIGVLIALALGAGFPHLHERARTLLEQPARTGMEAVIGQSAEVVRWKGASGTVRLAGTLWNATSDGPQKVGDDVSITAYSGSTLSVAPRIHHTT
jgi:membrane-bound ClpP family serine protease